MTENQVASAAYADSKPHYHILNGLRGVAALMVVFYHVFEAFATSELDQQVNHGYLAVDFFFLLSGFVIGYAYDDRWKSMSIITFLKRRIIRLHPMVVMGAVIGTVMFYTQDYADWYVSKTTVAALLMAFILNALLIPATPTSEIRGIGEMYPLNGPSWSLFFEYIGNILYALFIHKLSTKALAVLVAVAGVGLASYAIVGPTGHIGVGWTMNGSNMLGGSFRLLFSFSAGLLLARLFIKVPFKITGAFGIGAVALIILLALPRVGGAENIWLNGVYDAFCAIIVFPAIVLLGAADKTTNKTVIRVSKFLGDLSYPLYMVHYPFLYLYYAWVKNNNLTFEQSLPGAAALVFGSIALAWICLKLYDEPVRKYLSARFLSKKKKKQEPVIIQ